MNITSTKSKYSEFVARYKRYREFTRELQNHALIEYLPKKAITFCGKKLGIMRNNTLILGQMDEIGVVMDYCIYDYRQKG
ncbi:MAG: hypothetical protein JXM79_01780 [Sedimentisphaerales bacterium]|nr:hypothetical protein [Sedimentisphaerales bacterium]